VVVRPGETVDLAAALGRAFTARYPAGPARYLV